MLHRRKRDSCPTCTLHVYTLNNQTTVKFTCIHYDMSRVNMCAIVHARRRRTLVQKRSQWYPCPVTSALLLWLTLWRCACVCIQVPSYCLLSFEQRREERVPVKLASFIPSMVIIISWGLEYFIYCEPVCVCVHVCERLYVCVKACLRLVCVHVFMIF